MVIAAGEQNKALLRCPSAADLLCALADPARPRIDASNVAIVVAHPDDETIGCGAQIARLVGVTLIVVTDGAPANLADARSHGFATSEHYATARWTELQEALRLGEADRARMLTLAVPDQGVAGDLAQVADRLHRILIDTQTRIVLTHAYEGGHPDHDGVAFAVHAAAGRLAALEVIEMPFYHLGQSGGIEVQRFARGDRGIQVALSEQDRARKARMFDAHGTQRRTLAQFHCDCELFRPAPAMDFRQLPNDGHLYYARFDWGLDAPGWLCRVDAALAALSEPALP